MFRRRLPDLGGTRISPSIRVFHGGSLRGARTGLRSFCSANRERSWSSISSGRVRLGATCSQRHGCATWLRWPLTPAAHIGASARATEKPKPAERFQRAGRERIDAGLCRKRCLYAMYRSDAGAACLRDLTNAQLAIRQGSADRSVFFRGDLRAAE